MTERIGEKRLGWAFAIALVLHAAALAAAARIPAQPAVGGELEGIRVFDAAAPMVISPVELVQWSPEGDPEEVVTLASLAPAPQPTPVRTIRPTPRVPEARPRVPAEVAQVVEPVQVPVTPRPVSPRPVTNEGGTRSGGGGGGGGGTVDMGSPSANGDLRGLGGGGTPAGELSGEGVGSGSGVGAGSGGGRGGGSGGGLGVGDGTGVGEGSGSGSGGGSRDGGGFTSRVADRAEPVVVSKGVLEYPAGAIADGREGTVRLEVLVTETGTVAEVRMVESSGDRRLDLAAQDWVRRWRYNPAVQDGQARRVHTHATVRFELN